MKKPKIFVNLPVKNLKNSIDFFTRLGFSFNQQFTDQNATCMVVGEDIFIMLLVQDFFKTFTKKQISDAEKTTEVIVALSVSSKEEVNAIVKSSLDAGGKISKELGYMEGMYGGGFEDLDGHLWEIFCMDPGAIKQD